MSSSKPFSLDEFKDIYSKVPRLCVEVIVKTPEGVVLSLRKLPSWYGKWHIPGGTVFYKEKVADAVKRVAGEELGIKISSQELLGYIEYPSEGKEVGFGTSVGLAFLCSAEAASMKPNNDASEIKIFKSLPDNMIDEQYNFLKAKWEYINKD
ncbi:MAG: NUDIX hydrolase [Candidatus Yanofskybacteria bacterium]|nr:NUDIX hydrolase [Candidatus Yanofskybacteria bacterium]